MANLVWLFLLMVPASLAYFNPAEKLVGDLLRQYGSTCLRPIRNQDDPIEVTLDAPPSAVFEFVELRQKITLQTHFTMIWKDEKLTWVEDEYNGTDIIHLPLSEIWVPDIVVVESTDHSSPCPASTLVTVTSDGTVTATCLFMTTTFCRILVKYFPFDYQHCSLTYMSWVYDHSMFHLEEQGHDLHVDGVLVNGVWELADLEVEHIDPAPMNCSRGSDGGGGTTCEHSPHSQIRYTVELRRTQSLFYGIALFLPSCLMSFMNILVFCLPVESGEKISFIMTNVLALILFQQLVSSSLPPSGDDHPIVGNHLARMVISGCVAIVCTVGVLRVHYRRTPFPKTLLRIFRSPFIRCLLACIRFESFYLRRDEAPPKAISSLRRASHNGSVKTHPTHAELVVTREIANQSEPRQFCQEDMVRWEELARLLDWVICIVIAMLNIFFYAILIVDLVTQDPDEYHHGIGEGEDH